MQDEPRELKTCSQCGEVKATSEFYRRSRGDLFAECKRCFAHRTLTNYHKNPLAQVLRLAKKRAEKAGVPFTLTLENLPPVPETCPAIKGAKLERVKFGKGARGLAPSLDRVIPSLGYIPENVVWVSNRVNASKGNLTPEEHMAAALWHQQTHDKVLATLQRQATNQP
jgi:hypothetical protein